MSRHPRGQSSFRGTLLSRRYIAKRRSAIGILPFRRRLHIEPLEDRRLLATITVDTLADGVGVPGTSLREAIAAANPNDTIDFAVTGTIQLIGTGDLVINKPLTIQGPGQSLLTIQAYDFGPGAGNGSSIFFIGDLDNGVQFDVEISGLTLTGGDTIGRGGAIRCTESLVLSDCTITGNAAVSQGGGIYFRYGDLIVSRCTITGNTSGLGGGIMAVNSTTLVENSLITNNQSVNPGGGIHSFQSNMVVNNTTISGNSASGTEGGGGINEGGGGGIRSYQGNLEITGSTISGNMATAQTDGGGVDFNQGILAIKDSTVSGNSGHDGGGIHIFLAGTQTATITNSTISGNTASEESGGINCEGGITIIRHSTITNNTGLFAGGLLHRGYNGSTTQIHSTIISGNTGTDVVEFIDAGGGPLVSNGYNLIGTTNVPAKFNQPGDQVGVTNPMLAPLANNGGRTFTHIVLPGSPALDAGNPAFAAPPSNDQRGAPFVRVFDGDGAGGARIDIGAYERQTLPGLNLVVDTLADENDGNYIAGDLSLREAVLLANGSVGANTITFHASLAGGTILLKAGELWVTDAVTIIGLGATLLTIDASASDPTPNLNNGDGSRVFRIDDRIFDAFFAASISGLTLTGGDADFRGGGAIVTDENLTVTDCIITNNAAVGSFGGGIRADRAPNLTVTDSTISGNTAAQGGGISSGTSNSLYLTNSTVSGNTATLHGGGVYHNANVIWSISDSVISGNTASSIGGGIYGRRGHLYLTRSTVSGNSASYGGGVFQQLNNLTIRNTTISGNQSPHSNGGGIEVVSATLNVHNSTISGNVSGAGGGILSYQSTTTINNSTITNNYGSFAGGGINVTGPGTTTLNHTIVAGNTGDLATRDDISGPVSATYSFIGDNTGAVITNNGGNQIGTGAFSKNPMLGPLADNFGPTKTHALLSGSTAIDAGHPVFIAFPNIDQRGEPFVRVFDGDDTGGARVDIGAFELQPPPPGAIGDFNDDDAMDAADYVMWRKLLGTRGEPPYSGADGDGDGMVNPGDYDVWRTNFGESLPGSGGGEQAANANGGAGSGGLEQSNVESQELIAVSAAFPRNAGVGEPAVQIPIETLSAPEDTVATRRAASFGVFETQTVSRDASSRSRRTTHRFQETESGGDDLPLLLAIDRIGRKPQQALVVGDVDENDEHRHEDGIEIRNDDPLRWPSRDEKSGGIESTSNS